MAKATLNGVVLAESDSFEVVEGNIYFPSESVNTDYLSASDTTTSCPWKGVASYYNITINGETVTDAAWYYPTPKSAASQIENHVAFYTRKVEVER